MDRSQARSPVIARALEAGRAAFGSAWRPEEAARAPGRIELIGNHLDYNGGPVLAAAIDRSIATLIDRQSGAGDEITVVMADTSDARPVTFDVQESTGWRNSAARPESVDYVRGAIAALLDRDQHGVRTGVQLSVAGDVPIGFGVSSSAALCVSLTLALSAGPLPPRDLVLVAQDAEHRAGTPCGTMDQSASVAGGVIRFDGATLEARRLEPELGDQVFVLADSGVERSLGASSYPARVKESKEALETSRRLLRQDISHLAAINYDDLNQLDALDDETVPPALKRRVRHVVTETRRVEEGLEALQEADWIRFGRLMTASGRSSATDYEISHPRVEALVAEALAVDGVLGARMMGGGEGGAALVLATASVVASLEERLRTGYYTRHGMAGQPSLIHACSFAAGAALTTSSETLP